MPSDDFEDPRTPCHPLLDRLGRKAMLAFEIVSTSAILRVVTRQVLDMVLRAVIYLLLVDPNGAVTVLAPDVLAARADCLSNQNFLPLPLFNPVEPIQSSPFTTCHQVVWHWISSSND